MPVIRMQAIVVEIHRDDIAQRQAIPCTTLHGTA
jgi:hypothetical protein